jgi:hypothetical protein
MPIRLHDVVLNMLSTGIFFSMALVAHSGPRPLIQFRNHFSQTVGLLGRVISPSQGLYLHTDNANIEQTQTQTSMRSMGFEPTIPASERAKTGHVLDRSATVTGTGITLPFSGNTRLRTVVLILIDCKSPLQASVFIIVL